MGNEYEIKPDYYYYDNYDRETIKHARTIEDPEKLERYKYYRWKSKESSIQNLKELQLEYNLRIISSKPPVGIKCRMCGRQMTSKSPTISDDKVLYFFECPLGHLPKRAIYEDGTEKKFEPTKCSKCNSSEIKTEIVKDEKQLTFIDTCLSCGFVDKMELTLQVEVEVINEEERKKYCMTDKEAEVSTCRKTEIFFEDLKKLADFLEQFKPIFPDEKTKEREEIVKSIKILTISQMEKMFKNASLKFGFTKFSIGDPDMKISVFVPFSVLDPTENDSKKSIKELKNLIKGTLLYTNWRLHGDISYRLGRLSGKLKAFESMEDLIKLAEEIIKSNSK